ncbi:MAG TPA: DUF3597 family protein, partial [Acidocella sp.]
MSIFGDIVGKIFGSAQAAAPAADAAADTAPAVDAAPAADAAPADAATPAEAAPVVDVAAVLDGLEAAHGGGLNWRESIVDMLKLLDMDSSHDACEKLADELHFTGDKADSAAMNE